MKLTVCVPQKNSNHYYSSIAILVGTCMPKCMRAKSILTIFLKELIIVIAKSFVYALTLPVPHNDIYALWSCRHTVKSSSKVCG